MARNAYIERMKTQRKEDIITGQDFGIQRMSDCVILALHDPDIMGKNTFSAERCRKFLQVVDQYMNYFQNAFVGQVESDYKQEEMDRMLKPLCGKYFVPFKERYPMIKDIDYSKGKKEWRE